MGVIQLKQTTQSDDSNCEGLALSPSEISLQNNGYSILAWRDIVEPGQLLPGCLRFRLLEDESLSPQS